MFLQGGHFPLLEFEERENKMKRQLTSLEEKIYSLGILPVVTIEDAENASPMAEALQKGGLPCAEITFRTEAAEEAIYRIRESNPSVLCGAGTILSLEQLKKAVAAGAQFIVTPGLQPKIVEAALSMGIPIFPGCATPGEVETALSLGVHTVKFFPAEAAGGVAMLKSMSAPYGMMRFIPTGGIDEKNLSAYTALHSVLACGGSFIVKKEWMTNKNYTAITDEARHAIAAMLQFSVGHVGIIAANKENCQNTADILSRMLLTEKHGNASGNAYMVGDYFEVMCNNTNGERGHVCIHTVDVPRAAAYLQRMGLELMEETAQYEENGALRMIYCKDTWCGMGIHLSKYSAN